MCVPLECVCVCLGGVYCLFMCIAAGCECVYACVLRNDTAYNLSRLI